MIPVYFLATHRITQAREMDTTRKDLLHVYTAQKSYAKSIPQSGADSDLQPFSAIGEHVSGATRILEKRRQMLEVRRIA